MGKQILARNHLHSMLAVDKVLYNAHNDPEVLGLNTIEDVLSLERSIDAHNNGYINAFTFTVLQLDT